MKRALKENFVEEFRDRVEKASVFYLTDFSGLDVKSMTDLRHRIREAGAEYMVVKNRLVLRALEGLDVPDLSDFLNGPTGVVIGRGGVVEPAKALSEFARTHEDRPVFKVGVLDSKVVEVAQFERLAKLPPREQLLSEVAGVLQAPMAALAAALQGKLQEMAGLIEALREQKEG